LVKGEGELDDWSMEKVLRFSRNYYF